MKRYMVIGTFITLSILLGAFITMDLGLLKPTAAQGKDIPTVAKRDAIHAELQAGKVDSLNVFVKVAEMAQPSVVHIAVERKMDMTGHPFFNREMDPFFGLPRQPAPKQEFKQQGEGSGMIVSEDGYVITNNHVVEKSETIFVFLSDGRRFKAKTVGMDPATDIALLKIEEENLNLVPVIFGDSDAVKIGEAAAAIGNPMGLENTLTTGVISARGRSRIVPFGDVYENCIQTDAAINKGNSGGPLFNTCGEVIGMNTAIITDGSMSQGSIGLGFAIPVNMVKYVVGQLKEKGSVTRGWLGVYIGNITPEIADKLGIDMHQPGSMSGVYVSEVLENSPAADAGIQKDDIIFEINGKKVETSTELRSKVAMTAIESTARVKLMRKGEIKELDVKIGVKDEKLASRGTPLQEDFHGMALKELTAEQARRFGHDAEAVQVMRVDRDSPGAKAGIEPFDIILKVGRTNVATITELKTEAEKFDLKDGIPLVVLDNHGQHAAMLQEVPEEE